MIATLQMTMAILLFLAGLAMVIGGLLIIMTREYQETMRVLSSQSAQLHHAAIADVTDPPGAENAADIQAKGLLELPIQTTAEGMSKLLLSVSSLLRTAMGTGAFLAILGTLVCLTSFWLLTLVQG